MNCAATRRARSPAAISSASPGLGLATAVLGGAMPGLKPRKAYAALSGTLNFTTWPNYFAQENFDKFTKDTGVKINVAVFGSNEEMLAKLQAGSTGWDVFVPTNYTISTYKDLDLIEPLDLAKLAELRRLARRIRASRRRAPSTARSMPCRRTGAPPALSSTPRT